VKFERPNCGGWVSWYGRGGGVAHVSELSSFIDRVDGVKGFFEGGRYIWCVEEVGLDLCYDVG
jgi:hypothetical protein